MEKRSIWLLIALILSLESGGQASTDTTLRLQTRMDEVIKTPRGTSILVTYWSTLLDGSKNSSNMFNLL